MNAPRMSARVEAYLDQILAPLTRRLSQFQREELRRELREHLWERISGYRELGMAEDEAVTKALRQFGGAEDFLRQWQREWARASGRLTLRDVYKAGKLALSPSLLGIIGVNLLYLVVQECVWRMPGSPVAALMNRHSVMIGLSLAGFSFLMLPLFVGARHGRRTPERAGVGMLATLTAEILVLGLLYGVVALTLPDAAFGGINNMLFAVSPGDSRGTTYMLLNFLLATPILWIPIASGAAAISGWRTRRSRTRRLA